MTRIIALLALFCLGFTGFGHAQAPAAQPLYPQGAGESNGLPKEGVVTTDDNVVMAVDADYFLYRADPEKATGQAVVICPGGGYAGVAYAHEGLRVAEWLNGLGITAVVLRYRMPNGHSEIPLKDAQTALRMVREHAPQWGVDPQQVGIMGFSAGGHLAATASTHFTDERDRPDFSILIYPVITMQERETHAGSRQNLLGRDAGIDRIDLYSNERQVSDRTPRTFIALSDDDKGVSPVNSTKYYEALKAHDIPAELHVYPSGGHGWGWRESFKYHNELTGSLARWLNEIRKQ